MIPVSVIIPFYNSAHSLKKTTESLLNQSLCDIEYIFIDDGSTDNSKSIIEDVLSLFPHKRSQVTIINSSPDGKNCGIAQTRQVGLDAAHGNYIIFCDSDDWVDADYYRQLYETAVKTNASMVVGDYCTENITKMSRIVLQDIKDWNEFKQSTEWFHLSLWNRLIKLSLIRNCNILFYPGINFSEDYGFLIRIYYYSTCIVNSHSNSLYHYNKTNNNSLTTTLDFNSQQQRIKCLQLIDSFLTKRNENLKGCGVHEIEKYSAKDALLSIDQFKLWQKTFPEVTKMILRDANRSYIYKLVYILGQYLNWRLLWLYHLLHKYVSK